MDIMIRQVSVLFFDYYHNEIVEKINFIDIFIVI